MKRMLEQDMTWENKRGKGLRKCCRTETYITHMSITSQNARRADASCYTIASGWACFKLGKKVKERPKVNENMREREWKII